VSALPASAEPLSRDFFDRSVLDIAPDLLGRGLFCNAGDGLDPVVLRLTEVEAYAGVLDPGSHAFRGRTPRNGIMFGPPGFVYVYFTYGMHWCANLVCDGVGHASAVLLRAGGVVSGVESARKRRASARNDAELARGPARLTQALGITRALGGADACSAESPLQVRAGDPPARTTIRNGPRTGVSGDGGDPATFPWRFWIDGAPSVSPYRPHVPKRRS